MITNLGRGRQTKISKHLSPTEPDAFAFSVITHVDFTLGVESQQQQACNASASCSAVLGAGVRSSSAVSSRVVLMSFPKLLNVKLTPLLRQELSKTVFYSHNPGHQQLRLLL